MNELGRLTILVCPNATDVSGAPLVALDLAAAAVERGHRVLVLGPPGPLVERLGPLGLEWVESIWTDDGSAPVMPHWPSPAIVRQLRQVVRRERVDVVHTYEWPRALEAAYGTTLLDGTPLVASVLAVRAPRHLPRNAHLVVGARALAEEIRGRGYRRVSLIEPRLDRLPRSSALAAAGAALAADLDLDPALPTAAMACRLSGMKLDSLHLAIDAVEHLESTRPFQLVIAGAGRAQGEVHEHATAVNARLGRTAIRFTGLVADVGPVYEVADVVVGMGTSVLVGMGLARPAVVVGQEGFSELLTTETADALSAVGFWGVGGADGGVERLAGHLVEAVRDPARTAELVASSLAEVAARPSREDTDQMIEDVYRAAVGERDTAGTRALATARSFSRFAAMRGRSRVVHRVPGLARPLRLPRPAPPPPAPDRPRPVRRA